MSSLSVNVVRDIAIQRNAARADVAKHRSFLFFAVVMALLVGGFYIQQSVDLRQAALWFVGAGIGFVLYQTHFGFTRAWRAFVTQRDGSGLRAQLLLLALTSLLFLPLMELGSLFGTDLYGIIRPVGVSLLAGAFIFGIGMQLAGGCSSGTLVGLGGGRHSLLLTIVGIVIGATVASAHWEWWSETPSWFAFSARHSLGLSTAIVLNLLIIAALAAVIVVLEKRRHGQIKNLISRPLLWAALALTGLNLATLLLAGRPWVIANAFPLWGAQLSQWLGLEYDFMFWEFWSSDSAQLALESGIWRDVSSVMNFAIVLGALAAAAWARRYLIAGKTSVGILLAAALGGLLLGYGAVIGLGCNIGAFVAGVVSGSAHGWIWFIAAFAGSTLGVYLRPWFGLSRD